MVCQRALVGDGDDPKTLISQSFPHLSVLLGLSRLVVVRTVDKNADPFME